MGILRYGVWALIGSLIPFLEILELGFASATIAFVSRHLELEDDEQVARTLNTSFLVLSVLGAVAFAGVVVFAIFLPDIITSIPKSMVGQAQFLLLLLAFDMALSIPLDTFGGVLSALQRFDLLNFSLIGVTVSQAIGWIIVLWLHGGLIALGVVTVVMSMVGQASRLIMVRRLLPWFRFSFRGFDRGLVKRFTTASSWYSVGQVADAVLTLSDVLIVGAAAGVRAAAVYAVAQRLAQLPLKVVSPRTGLLFVKAGTLIARDNRAGLRETIDGVVGFVLGMSIPAAIAIGFLAGPAVEAWVGPLYRDTVPIIGLLVIAAVVQSWAVALKLSVNGAGYPKLTAAIFGSEAVIHVGLGIVLSARYGALGMAEAALIGVVLMEGALLLPLAYRWLGDSLAHRALRGADAPPSHTRHRRCGMGRRAERWLALRLHRYARPFRRGRRCRGERSCPHGPLLRGALRVRPRRSASAIHSAIPEVVGSVRCPPPLMWPMVTGVWEVAERRRLVAQPEFIR